jgi:hypothetical protein
MSGAVSAPSVEAPGVVGEPTLGPAHAANVTLINARAMARRHRTISLIGIRDTFTLSTRMTPHGAGLHSHGSP